MSPQNDSNRTMLEQKYLFVLALFSTLITTVIASCYPSGRPVDEIMSLSFASSYAWVLAQSIFLTMPIFFFFGIVSVYRPRFGVRIGSIAIMLLPVVCILDVLTFSWIGERFLSAAMAHIVKTLLPALTIHTTSYAAGQGVLLLLLMVVLFLSCSRLSSLVARKWKGGEEAVPPLVASLVVFAVAALFTVLPVLSWETVHEEMRRSSTRHPFCAFHVIGYRGVGQPVLNQSISLDSRLRGLRAISAVQSREKKQLAVAVDQKRRTEATRLRQPPRVIMVVVECLRPEVVDPQLMPNLHRFSKQSILCETNFSGGNSTCLGMFSLLNGLEAIWFNRAIKDEPIFNRLFRQAGYELAFFGGQTDWRTYHMDGFISESHYDRFVIEEPSLPATDLRAVERTLSFLSMPESSNASAKSIKAEQSAEIEVAKAALCYLYGTHSSFRYSDPKYRVFLPESDEGLLISHSPELKEQFYNRYKNSLRSMDDILEPLLRDDCIVVVMGDHGEPFLDDGTASHGTRLSRYQNMTPALIYYPGVEPRIISEPTFHADILPTLLSVLGISTTDSSVFDGLDLTDASSKDLQERVFASCNFMDSTSLLVGPWTTATDEPFGFRFVQDIWRWQSDYLNPVDELGYELDETEVRQADDLGEIAHQQWLQTRFQLTPTADHVGPEALEEGLRSTDVETQLASLEIAATLEEPSDRLIQLIGSLAKSSVPAVRNRAKEMAIAIAKRRSWSSLLN